MGNKYNLIIWDLDGTLLDTSEGIIAAAKHTIEESGFRIPSDDVLKSFIGPPLQKSFVKEFNVTEEKAVKMANLFRTYYMDGDLLKANYYEGILSLVNCIYHAGIKQGVATYKRQDCAEKLLSYFGFSDYMNMIYGSDSDGRLTKTDIIKMAINESGVKDLDQIVMIGDSDSDQRGASQIGIDFIGVTYGFGFKDENVNDGHRYACSVDGIRRFLEI